jgi:radical SAM protein with 4Fe4S-binding SPASM domain
MESKTITIKSSFDVHRWDVRGDIEFHDHPAFYLSDDIRLGVPADNHLRRDTEQILFYGNSLFDTWSFHLLPTQVVILSFFDGVRTLDEIADIISFLSDCTKEESHYKLRIFLKTLRFSEINSFVDVSLHSEVPLWTPFSLYDYLIFETKQTVRLDAPTSIILMPTDQCFTDCEYCYACRHPVPKDNLLTTERLLELIDEAHQIGVISISVNGGDIFARPEHMVILERILQYNIEPGISTKAYISKHKAEELKKIGLNWLQVGLDSTREMCDKLVKRVGYFDRMVETIYNLTDAGIKTRTNSIITSESLPFLPDLVDFLMTLPLFDIKVASAFLGIYRGNEQMLLSVDQKKWYRKVMEDKVKQYPDHKINWECEEDILDASQDQISNWFKTRPYCSGGRTQIVIAPDGKVTTCEQSPQEGIFVCGDVTKQSIMEVWNSNALKKWYEPSQKEFKGTECYNCGDFQQCIHVMGHCWLQVYKMFGTIYAPHPYCNKSELPKQRWR